MGVFEIILLIFGAVMMLVIVVPVIIAIVLWMKDEKQEEHSVLRNYPLLGKMRYISEKMGPELRQYLFLNNNEGKPFSRNQYEQTVKSGKYLNRMMGFGSERDFNEPGYYIRNAVFLII